MKRTYLSTANLWLKLCLLSLLTAVSIVACTPGVPATEPVRDETAVSTARPTTEAPTQTSVIQNTPTPAEAAEDSDESPLPQTSEPKPEPTSLPTPQPTRPPRQVLQASLDVSAVFIADGFSEPVGIVSTNDGNGRLFVVDRPGQIRIVQPDGSTLFTPFLDIANQVNTEWESGLLGVAFHPNYYENGYFFVNYVHLSGGQRETRISRFTVSDSDPNIANPDSEEILLIVDQPEANHNAGAIHFGPDGYLYIPLGDGGWSNNGQDMGLLLGKISRIDVNAQAGSPADCKGRGSGNYTIPDSNPFVDGTGNDCDEIWASGFRNPWQSSFDRLTGDLFLGDVGESDREEIDFQAANASGGENYGWHCYEGDITHVPGDCDDTTELTAPIFTYGRADGDCSVVGGYVYRGDLYPAMYGHYLSTDYCSGTFRDMLPDGSGGWTVDEQLHLWSGNFAAFGEASNCEIYLAGTNDGSIYHLEENSSSTPNEPVSAHCNERPLTATDIYELPEDNLLNVAAPGVLLNDSDINGDGLTAVLILPPTHGDVTLNSDGSFIYTPNATFSGSDSFTYQATDGINDSKTTTVTISESLALNYLPITLRLGQNSTAK